MPRPPLNLHAVKLVREGADFEKDLLREGFENREVGGGWVSGNRGLDPCHCIFLHLIQLLQNGLGHTSGSQRNLKLLWCHRGYARGNLGLLWLNGATAAVLLWYFSKGPRLGPIAIKDLQNKHK